MLHGTETWPMTSAALHRLCRNDRAMIRWICGVKPSDDPSMDELHAKLGICDLAILVRERRLRWFGHVMRSNGEINRVRSRPVPGRKGPGRPKKTWEECVKQDLKVCGLSEAGTQDRLSWRSSVKNSRQEPTPSNGSLLQSMAAPPARRVLGMRTRSFNKTGFDWLIDWAQLLQTSQHEDLECERNASRLQLKQAARFYNDLLAGKPLTDMVGITTTAKDTWDQTTTQGFTGVTYNTIISTKIVVVHARKETLLSLFSLSQPGLWPQYLLQAVSSCFLTRRVSADYDVDADDAFHDHEAII